MTSLLTRDCAKKIIGLDQKIPRFVAQFWNFAFINDATVLPYGFPFFSFVALPHYAVMTPAKLWKLK